MVVDKYVGRCLDVGSTPTGSIIPLHSFVFLGKTLLNQRLSLCLVIIVYSSFIHRCSHVFSYVFIYRTFVSLFKNGESIKIRFCYTKKALPVQKGGATSNDCRSVCCEIYRMSNYCWTCSLFNKSRTTIKKKPQHMLWSACWGFHIQ